MKRHFDEELGLLKKDLLTMASMVEDAIHKSVESLRLRDKKLAQAVINDDHMIDTIELIIEENCMRLLALRQPMAVDLRFITTGMKINAELERIADLAVNICQGSIRLSEEPILKPLIDIPRLSDLAEKMVKGSIDAFVKRDERLARKVILDDATADGIRTLVYEELINDYMIKDPAAIRRAVSFLLITRNLERICDHATNIAEDVIYLVKAKVVKHHPEELSRK